MGNKKYITRLTPNENNWVKPSGKNCKCQGLNLFEASINDYGHESYFVDNNILYCIVKDCLNACYFSLFSFNDISQTWTQSTLNNFSTNLNSGPGVFDAGGLLESFYKRNNTIYFSNNRLINNLQGPGQCTSHDICNGQITALSMKRQINLIIDSTSCYNNVDDSLMLAVIIQRQ